MYLLPYIFISGQLRALLHAIFTLGLILMGSHFLEHCWSPWQRESREREITHWLLKLSPESDTYHFNSFYIGQRKPQGHICVQGQAYHVSRRKTGNIWWTALMNSTVSTLMVNLLISLNNSINFYSIP